jgi:hypothetical protein
MAYRHLALVCSSIALILGTGHDIETGERVGGRDSGDEDPSPRIPRAFYVIARMETASIFVHPALSPAFIILSAMDRGMDFWNVSK